MMVVGVQGTPEFLEWWETTAFNYALTNGRIHRMTGDFFYFLTNKKRLEDNLTIAHQNMMFLRGDLERLRLNADGGWTLARKAARREIATITSENFYVRRSEDRGANSDAFFLSEAERSA